MQQQLLTYLDNEHNRKRYRYLLIDALTSVSEMDFISLNNIATRLGSNAIQTVKRPDLSADLSRCPKLVTIGEPNGELDTRIVHFSVVQALDEALHSKRYICGWFTSEQPPEMVAKQIVNIGEFVAHYSQMKFVPFYEPLRMQLLLQSSLVNRQWFMQALNVFNCYCYPQLNNTLQAVEPHQEVAIDMINLLMTDDIGFFQHEAKVLFQLYIAQYEITTPLDGDASQIDFMEIARWYKYACSLGLSHLNDRFVFVLKTLRHGDLQQNRQIKQAIDDAIFDPGSLATRFQAIDKQVFFSLR